MKKILCVLLAVLLVLASVLAVSATAEVEAPQEGDGPSIDWETVIDEEKTDHSEVDYVLLARQFAAYIQSGEAPEELINSFITMGEEMQQMKEDGYTLKERLLQLIAPENLLTTCTALFLIVGAIILFVLKKKQMNLKQKTYLIHIKLHLLIQRYY